MCLSNAKRTMAGRAVSSKRRSAPPPDGEMDGRDARMGSARLEVPSDALTLLRLVRLVSPSLPIGAFAYSQGLERAVDVGWVQDADAALDWMAGLLAQGLVPLDLAVLARLEEANRQGDPAARERWNARLLAARETAELRFEDVQMGGALWRLIEDLRPEIRLARPAGDRSLACAFAAAGVAWSIPRDSLLLGYAWCWLEHQVSAATKLVPLGQTAAQRILDALMPTLPARVVEALARSDEEIGAALPGLAWLSASHETQYSRLFRS